MKIESEVSANAITYSNKSKAQNEPKKMETNNADIVNISKEGVSKGREYLGKKESLYQSEQSEAVELDSTGADVWSQELSVRRSDSLQEMREKEN